MHSVGDDRVNVFVLSTGRCGSTTFIRACNHIRNYTADHESRVSIIGPQRLKYPDNHIESDNRLSWFLGRLEQRYGDQAYYVHLKRDRAETAVSYSRRKQAGLLMHAYSNGIAFDLPSDADPLEIAFDYYDTATANIEVFLQSKSRTMEFSLENAKEDFQRFWEEIGAKGDLAAALKEWEIPHNATKRKKPIVVRIYAKVLRILSGLPEFIRTV